MRNSGIQDISSSNGNLPLFNVEKEKTDKAGKQIVSIPIAIGKQKKQETEKPETVSTVVCKVSGCAFQILIDKAVLGLQFKWESPLASQENALQIANLPKMKMVGLPAEILAGTAISLLSSKSLLVGKSSNQAVNRFLVEALTSEQLVENIIRIKKIVETRSKKDLPSLSKDNFDKHSLPMFITDVLQVLFPSENRVKETSTETVIIRTRKRKVTEVFDLSDEDEITSEVRKEEKEEKQSAAEMLREWLKSRKG